METLGVYIQVPFCQSKCTYCNFDTGVVSGSRYAPYVAALCREIGDHQRLLKAAGIRWGEAQNQATSPLFPPWPGRVHTVYIGGGTPSLLDGQLLSEMLAALRENFSCSWEEVTLEADPETVERQKVMAWRAAGINRISLGTQSFANEELRAAGRMHRSEDIFKAVSTLRGCGIGNLSFDLIAGLPKQTQASWNRSLQECIALAPEHVSVYLLEIDEGSRLGREVRRGGIRYSTADLPDENKMADCYELAQRELGAAGYEQYEISNWAKPGFRSLHNLKYWRREPYLGFGAGAHSFSGQQRWANLPDAAAYVSAISNGDSAVCCVEEVTSETAFEEELFLGLRQPQGIDLTRLERHYGVNLEKRVARLAASGLLERQGDNVRLRPNRLTISNEVIVELLQ